MSVTEAVDAYLAEVEAEMRGSFWEKQAIRTELRAHLFALAKEYELAGVHEADAMRHAMRDFGYPGDIGQALGSSRGRNALRVGQFPRGEIAFERSNRRPLPPILLLVALAAIAASSIGILATFAWP